MFVAALRNDVLNSKIVNKEFAYKSVIPFSVMFLFYGVNQEREMKIDYFDSFNSSNPPMAANEIIFSCVNSRKDTWNMILI